MPEHLPIVAGDAFASMTSPVCASAREASARAATETGTGVGRVRRKRGRETGDHRCASALPADGPIRVPTGVTEIASDGDARELATRLLTPGRRRWPVAVVTIASGEHDPYVDVDQLADALRGLVEVVVMPTSDVSWAFSGVMPSSTQVYGGASRV